MNLTSYGLNCIEVTGSPICFPTALTSNIRLIDFPGTAAARLTLPGSPSTSRKRSKRVPVFLNEGLLFISITFGEPLILSVSIENVFNSSAPAGKVLVGKGFLSLQAYFVAKVFVVSAVDVS